MIGSHFCHERLKIVKGILGTSQNNNFFKNLTDQVNSTSLQRKFYKEQINIGFT